MARPLTVRSRQGELEHRHVKRFYARTNKVRYTMQIARRHRKRALLESIRRRDQSFTPRWEENLNRANMKREAAEVFDRCAQHAADRRQDDPLPPTPPSIHHEVSKSQRSPIRLYTWLAEHRKDPATKVAKMFILFGVLLTTVYARDSFLSCVNTFYNAS